MQLETIADIKLVGRAMNEGWPVSEEIKKEVVAALRDIIGSGDPDLIIPASRALMAADGLTQRERQAQEKKLDREHKRKLELIELAVKLGIIANEPGAIGALDSQSSRVADQ